jgi:hypothetical protein
VYCCVKGLRRRRRNGAAWSEISYRCFLLTAGPDVLDTSTCQKRRTDMKHNKNLNHETAEYTHEEYSISATRSDFKNLSNNDDFLRNFDFFLILANYKMLELSLYVT